MTPVDIPATEIIAKVESAVRQLDIERADTVRSAVKTILQQAESRKPSITGEQKDALKSLKEDNFIMVLPGDKGCASVVLDTDTYHAKMSVLIHSGPYQLLNKDPTERVTRKLSQNLLTLKRHGHISEAVYNKIRPRHKQPPRIYGLPKIHKTNTPLKPIVSCVNTFPYNLSAFLANILSPLTGNSDITITKSAHFESIISSEKIKKILARTQTLAVTEHTHKTGHYLLWNEVKFIDRDSHWYTRRVKEAIHLRLHPNNTNRDSGIEIPEAWMPTVMKHNRRMVQQQTAEGTNSCRNNEDRNAPSN